MGHRNFIQEAQMEREGWLTVQEAHRRCKMSQNAMYKLIKDGRVSGLKIGRRQYINKKELKKVVGPVMGLYLDLVSEEITDER